jgi:UDP-sugar pyrophosphorylase
MQDTNGLALHSLDAVLGVSMELELEVNSLAIPRKAKQAIGGIARLMHSDGRAMTINVEYNQLDPLLRSSGSDGDTNDPETGFSPYPGNINQLVFAMEPYCKVLEQTGGFLKEFVNPKYTDNSRTTFKKPTRLECMMQDYPRLLSPDAKIGFTSMEPWLCFSPVKNSLSDALAAQSKGSPPASASSGEADQYNIWSKFLKILGCKIESEPEKIYAGIHVSLGPRIVIDPNVAILFDDLNTVFTMPSEVSISQKSTLLIQGPGKILIEKLNLDGTLILKADQNETLHIKNLTVCNNGWSFEELKNDDSVPEILLMRGYSLAKKSQAEVHVQAGEGLKVIDRSDVVDVAVL